MILSLRVAETGMTSINCNCYSIFMTTVLPNVFYILRSLLVLTLKEVPLSARIA
jgi:hypothetical protein